MRKKAKISVVIQGPVVREILPNGRMTTEFCIEQCKNILPNSEIIFSTWRGEDVAGINVDRIVFNKDPGSQGVFKKGAVANNVNRQIISSVSGLLYCSEEKSLKIRSDAILQGSGFVDIFDSLTNTKRPHQIFNRKIICNNLSTKNPNTMNEYGLHFHPADHVHFGLTEDLIKLWNIPLQSPEDAYFFLSNPRPNNYRDDESSRLTPEQYICVSAFAKYKHINLANYSDKSYGLQAEKMLLDNFVFVSDYEYSIYIAKYHNYYHEQFRWMRYESQFGLQRRFFSKIKP